jgi:hypothetical protein
MRMAFRDPEIADAGGGTGDPLAAVLEATPSVFGTRRCGRPRRHDVISA